MKTFSALLAMCAENSPVPGEFPAQRPVTRTFDVFFDLRLIGVCHPYSVTVAVPLLTFEGPTSKCDLYPALATVFVFAISCYIVLRCISNRLFSPGAYVFFYSRGVQDRGRQ